MFISVPRGVDKSYCRNLAKKHLGSYVILKGGVWYKVTKQYSSVNNKLTYLGESEELLPLGMKVKYAIVDEYVK